MSFYINEFILNCRLEKKLTQKALAKKAKVSQGYLSKIENDQVDPSLQEVIKIVEALGYTLTIRKTK